MRTKHDKILRLGLMSVLLGLTPTLLTTDSLAQATSNTMAVPGTPTPPAPAASQPLVAPGSTQQNQIMNQDANAAMEALKARQAETLRGFGATPPSGNIFSGTTGTQNTQPLNQEPLSPLQQGDFSPFSNSPDLTTPNPAAEAVSGR